jgi:GntR family transcriptional regulator
MNTTHFAQEFSPKSSHEPFSLLTRLRVDSETTEPYYLQITRQIQAMINTGELDTGVNLPSERDLAEALRVSRTTVKRCYDTLRESKALSTHGRGGTVVQAPPRVNPTLGKLKGFTQEMCELGMTPSSQVLEHELVQDRTVASIFQRPSSASFLKLTRLRSADGTPMTREVAWYDLTLAPNLANWDTSGSAYDFLKNHCSVVFVSADQTVEAVMSSPEESKAFGFTAASPCLLFKRRSYTHGQQLAEYVEGTFRGDAYAYKIQLSI